MRAGGGEDSRRRFSSPAEGQEERVARTARSPSPSSSTFRSTTLASRLGVKLRPFSHPLRQSTLRPSHRRFITPPPRRRCLAYAAIPPPCPTHTALIREEAAEYAPIQENDGSGGGRRSSSG